MSEHGDFRGESGAIQWRTEVRGYNRQQVDEHVARQAWQVRELENRLSQSLAEIERLRVDVTDAREAGGRPAHEELSERMNKILELAVEEAKVERERGNSDAGQLREAARQETEKLRADTKRETDQVRASAQDQAERMLAAAAEQSERSVSAAKAEADRLVSTAQAAADQAVTDATKHAETTVAAAIAQAKQQLDEATARATAIHDGAERRLNLLISRHTETVRRLTEIRDVVTNLVAGETSRGSLEDEVARAMTAQAGGSGPNGTDGRQSTAAPLESQAGAHRAGSRPGAAIDGRRAAASAVAAGHDHSGPAPRAAQSAGSGRPNAFARPREAPDALTEQHDARPADQASSEADDRENPTDNLRGAGGLAGTTTRSATRTLDETPAPRRGTDD